MATAAVLAALLGGCDGMQSALAPHGPMAARIALLTWVLFALGATVFAVVLLATWGAVRGSDGLRRTLAGSRAVAIGGIAFPALTLSLLLAYGIWLTQAGVPAGEYANPLRIEVVGEQWWWRVRYRGSAGQTVASANEIRIPTNQPVEFALKSADVIHSFWVPALGGKVDMVPGRTTYLRVIADRPGVLRGQCAEYCGGAHALMALEVIAVPSSEHTAWLTGQAAPAAEPTSEQDKRGRQLFVSSGCGACHAIRGTPAQGAIGPDLTHIGSRRSLAASTLPLSKENIARFIVDNQHIKPANRMPPYRIFSPDELDALAGYLASLR
jgi:cytochrome c oxidase subunit 2